jgi:hypothetical protein
MWLLQPGANLTQNKERSPPHHIQDCIDSGAPATTKVSAFAAFYRPEIDRNIYWSNEASDTKKPDAYPYSCGRP